MGSSIDLMPAILFFFRRWRLTLVNIFLALACGVVYAFLIVKVEYSSTVTFLPPSGEARTFSGILQSLPLSPDYSPAVSAEQVESIFNSTYLRKAIIDRFNLYRHYRVHKSKAPLTLALKKLEEDLELENLEMGNMGFMATLATTITCFHTNRDTAYEMASYCFFLIDSTIRSVSAEKGRRQRVFIEAQLAKKKASLDSLRAAMTEFQLEKKAFFNVPEQLSISIKAYAELKALEQSNEIKLSLLRKTFRNETPEMRQFQEENRVFRRKMAAIEKNIDPSVMMGLKYGTTLMPEYENFIRDVEIQNTLVMYISKEYEEALIKEERDVSFLSIIDPPYVADYKSRPKRFVLLAAVFVIYMLSFGTIIICIETFTTHPRARDFFASLKKALSEKPAA